MMSNGIRMIFVLNNIGKEGKILRNPFYHVAHRNHCNKHMPIGCGYLWPEFTHREVYPLIVCISYNACFHVEEENQKLNRQQETYLFFRFMFYTTSHVRLKNRNVVIYGERDGSGYHRRHIDCYYCVRMLRRKSKSGNSVHVDMVLSNTLPSLRKGGRFLYLMEGDIVSNVGPQQILC